MITKRSAYNKADWAKMYPNRFLLKCLETDPGANTVNNLNQYRSERYSDSYSQMW